MKNEDYISQFWSEFDSEEINTIEKGVVSSIEPLTIILRGIEYTKLFISEYLIERTETVDITLKDKLLHGDVSHKDLLESTVKHKSVLEVGDVVVVIQSRDKQSLTILDKVVAV